MPKHKNNPSSLARPVDASEISTTTSSVIAPSSNLSALKPYLEGLKFVFLLLFVGAILGFIAFLFLPAVGIARAESTRRNGNDSFPLMSTDPIASTSTELPSPTEFAAATISQERFTRAIPSHIETGISSLHSQIAHYQWHQLPRLLSHDAFPFSLEIKTYLDAILDRMQRSRDSHSTARHFEMLKNFAEACRLTPIVGAIIQLSQERASLEQHSRFFDMFIDNYRPYQLSADFCDIEAPRDQISKLINLYNVAIDMIKQNKDIIRYLLNNLKTGDAFDLLINNNENLMSIMINHFSYHEIFQLFSQDNFFRKISLNTFLANFMSQVHQSVDVPQVAAMFDFFEFYETEVTFNADALQFIRLAFESNPQHQQQRRIVERAFKHLGTRYGSDKMEVLENIVQRAEQLHQTCKTNMYYLGMIYAPSLWDKLFSTFEGYRRTPERALALTMHIEESWAPEPSLRVHQLRLSRLLNKLALTEHTTFHMSDYSCTLRELLEVTARTQGLDYFQHKTASLLHYRDFYATVTDVTNYHELLKEALLEKAKDPLLDVDQFVDEALYRQKWQRLFLMVSATIGIGAGIITAFRWFFNKSSTAPNARETAPRAPRKPVIEQEPSSSSHAKQSKSGASKSVVDASTSDATTTSGHTPSVHTPVAVTSTPVPFIHAPPSIPPHKPVEQRPQEPNSNRFTQISEWCQKQQARTQALLTRVSQANHVYNMLEHEVKSSITWLKSKLDAFESDLKAITLHSMPESDKQLDTLYLEAFENILEGNRARITAILGELGGYEKTLNACSTSDDTEPSAPSPLPPEANRAAMMSVSGTHDGAASSMPSRPEETPPNNATWVVLQKTTASDNHPAKKKTSKRKLHTSSSLHGQTSAYQLQLQMAQAHWTALIHEHPVALIDSSVSIHEQMETRMILWGWILEKTLALLDEHSIISNKISPALRKTAATLRNVLVHPFSNISNEQFNALANTLLTETKLPELSTKLEALDLAALLPKMGAASSSTQVITTQAMGPVFALNTLIYYLRLLERRAKAGVESMLASTTFPYIFRSQLIAIRECWHCANALIPRSNKDNKFLHQYFNAFILRANLEAHHFVTSQQVQKFLDFKSELPRVIGLLESHLPSDTAHARQASALTLRPTHVPPSSAPAPAPSMRADVADFNPYEDFKPYSVSGSQLFGSDYVRTDDPTMPFPEGGYRLY